MDKQLENTRKKLKIETLSTKDFRYRYYSFLLDMFKYGIIIDDLMDILDKKIELIFPDRGNYIIRNILCVDKKEIDIDIELTDNYPDEDDNNLLMVYTEILDDDLMERCILLENNFDKDISSLIRGAFIDCSHGMLLQGLSLIALIMPIKFLKRLVKEVEEAYRKAGYTIAIRNIKLFIMRQTTIMDDYYIPYEELDNYDDNRNLLSYMYEGELKRC